MTVKEQLHELIDQLSSDDAVHVLRFAESLQMVPIGPSRLPDFVGMGDSGRSDIAENAENILRAGFGR